MPNTCPKCGSRDILPDLSCRICLWKPRSFPSGIEAQVCADITARQKLGVEKYGVTVVDNPLNLKQWLQHAYEEVLDQAIYLKRAISEIP